MLGERVEHARAVRAALGVFFMEARVPIIAVEADGRFVSANDAALAQYGYSLEELVGMRIHDFMAEPRPELPEDLRHAHAGDEVILGRRPHRRKDGSVLWVVPRAGPVEVAGRRYIVSVLQDVTALVRAEQAAAAADRLAGLGRVAAGVAHEVNNPAAFVTMALPLVRARLHQERTDEALALLSEASLAMEQVHEVMRGLGDMARDRPRSTVDLAHLAGSALRIASFEAESRARVVRSFEGDVLVEVRAARLTQVLINLVLNAAQAIPPGTRERHRIEVRVRHAGGRAVIDVSDTGPGVPAEIAERIFEPFFTTRPHAGGTGLGLWLSRTAVEEEGGTLTWANREEGGAVFTVSLPAIRAVVAPARASAE